jgi:tetratricopeptide (TPR) repeat protein
MRHLFALVGLLFSSLVLAAEDLALPLSPPSNLPGTASVTQPDPAELLRDLARLKEARESLARERDKLAKGSVAAALADTAELASQRRRLAELLERLDQKRSGPVASPPDSPPVGPMRPSLVTKPPDPGPALVTSTEDPFLLAQAQFSAGKYEDSLAAYRRIDPDSLSHDERITVQFFTACCIRKLGKLEDAAVLYREVADAREDDFLTECALWHLSSLGWRRDVEKQLAELRKARQER